MLGQRPDAVCIGIILSGKTGDDKISSVYASGYQATNIVAVDVEVLAYMMIIKSGTNQSSLFTSLNGSLKTKCLQGMK